MKVFFTNERGVEKATATYVWGTHSVEFEVCIEMINDLPVVSVILPFETDLSDAHLLHGARAVLDQDDFEGLWLTYEGADENYAYTFEEVAEERWPDKVFAEAELICSAAVFNLVDAKGVRYD